MSQPTCNLFCIILLTEFITMIYWSDSELLLDFHPRVFSKCLQKSLIGGVLLMYLSSSLYLFSSLLLSFCWSGHVFSLLWSNVSKAKSLKDCSLKVFFKCICHCLCICLCLRCCFFVGQIMFSHHSDQMSQRSKVSKIEGVL